MIIYTTWTIACIRFYSNLGCNWVLPLNFQWVLCISICIRGGGREVGEKHTETLSLLKHVMIISRVYWLYYSRCEAHIFWWHVWIKCLHSKHTVNSTLNYPPPETCLLLILLYSRKLSREKTFTYITILQPLMKIFSRNFRHTILINEISLTFHKRMLPSYQSMKVSRYAVY